MTPDVMSSSAIDSRFVDAVAEEAYRRGTQEVAKQQGLIRDIGTASKKQIENVLVHLPERESVSVEAQKPVMPSDDVVAAVEKELSAKQAEMDDLTDHDQSGHVGTLEEGVAGVYDGRKTLDADLIAEGDTEEIRRTHLHETKHQKDGIVKGLDETLIKKTGIPAIDERLKTIQEVTRRDVLEKGAMMAEKAPPRGSYIEQHWRPSTRLEKAFEEAGLDGRKTLEKVEQDDMDGFREDTRLLLYHQLMERQTEGVLAK